MTLIFGGGLTTIYCVGDSHCLPFADFHFQDQASGEAFSTKSLYLTHNLRANAFVDAQGRLDSGLAHALEGAGILAADGTPRHCSEESSYLSATFITRQAAVAPPVVFFAGDVDLHFVIFRQMEGHDFTLPGDTPYPPAAPGCKPVPYQSVRTAMAGLLKPFLYGVTELRRNGLTQVMIHALPPRTTDEALFQSWLHYECPAPLRYKLTWVCNEVMRDHCAQNGIGFIDPWPVIAEGGWARPAYELDGLHMNREAAKVSLELIVAELLAGGRDRTNSRRYGLAWRRLGGQPPAQPTVTVLPAAAAVDELARGLDFGLDLGNRHARLCWTAMSAEGTGLSVAEPTQALLDALHIILFGAGGVLDTGFPATVTSCRPLRLEPEAGPLPSLGPSGTPPGMRRALLLLSDGQGDDAPLEHRDIERGVSVPLGGAKGTLILFDPAATIVRLRRPTRAVEFLDLCVGPRFAHQTARVVWAGMNLWPADPFQYSVRDMRASPPFTDDCVSVRPELLDAGPPPGERV